MLKSILRKREKGDASGAEASNPKFVFEDYMRTTKKENQQKNKKREASKYLEDFFFFITIKLY